MVCASSSLASWKFFTLASLTLPLKFRHQHRSCSFQWGALLIMVMQRPPAVCSTHGVQGVMSIRHTAAGMIVHNQPSGVQVITWLILKGCSAHVARNKGSQRLIYTCLKASSSSAASSSS